MTKYIWLCCIVLLVAGCNDGVEYPQDIEFRVGGTDGLAFWGGYGDTLEVNLVGGVDNPEYPLTVPKSYSIELDEFEMAVCFFQKWEWEDESDTLIVSLYVDDELFAIETTTTYSDIRLFYPEYPE